MSLKDVIWKGFVMNVATVVVIAIGFCVGCTSTPKRTDNSHVKEISGNAIKAPDNKFFLFKSNNKYAAVKFTQPMKKRRSGYEYVWYYQADQSGSFTNPNAISGKGVVYEKRPDEIPLGGFNDGETSHIKCVNFRVEWSNGQWVYLWDDTLQIAQTPFSNIEDVDCFDSNVVWIKRKL